MKQFLNRLQLLYHEGKGPTMTLAQADAAPAWAPLWIIAAPTKEFHAAATFAHRPPVHYYAECEHRLSSDEPNPTVVAQKADLLLSIPHTHAASAYKYERSEEEDGVVTVHQTCDYLKIIHAKIPQRISDHFPRARLLAAPHFRALHVEGYFSIVTSAYAEEFLKDPEAQKVAAVLRDLQARTHGYDYRSNN